jgi:hypothetical protein
MVGVLRGYVDFRATTRDEEDEFRYRAPLLDWWLLLTDGFKKGRLVVEKEPQTLAKAKLWVSRSVAPTLAMCVEHPGGLAWLEHVLVVGKSRLKEKHRRLLNTSPHADPSTSDGVVQ